jgi:hypothetical protein
MKTILTLALMVFSTFAAAGEIQIMKLYQHEMWGPAYSFHKFIVNPELGRAQIEVSLTRGPEGDSATTRIKLEGLSFDQLTNEVVLLHEGRTVVCATSVEKGRWFFRQSILKETGNCQFKTEWKDIVYDDGFEMKTTRHYIISLVVE